MTTSDVTLVGQDEQVDESTDVQTPPATGTEDQARIKGLLDRLAQTGREAAEAKRVSAAQAREIAELREGLGTLNASLNKAEQQKLDAYLSTLPPAERALEEIKQLRARQDASNRPAPRRAETDEEYTVRRTQEILAEVNSQFALDDDESLTGTESGLDGTNEAAFIKSARKLARKRMLGQSEEDTVTKKEAPKKDALPKTEDARADAERVKEDVLSQVRRELGISAPATPRPAGGRSGGPVTEDFRRTLTDYNPTQGTRGTIKALKEQLKAAEKAAR